MRRSQLGRHDVVVHFIVAHVGKAHLHDEDVPATPETGALEAPSRNIPEPSKSGCLPGIRQELEDVTGRRLDPPRNDDRLALVGFHLASLPLFVVPA